jgi:parallel beta-helix repeat protein
MFRDLLASLFRPSRRPARPRRFVPRLEGFEDRTVPATFNVAAGGSIQAAINSAAAASDGNDVINVAAATFTGNLVIPNSANLTNLVIQTTGNPTSENKMAVIKANSGAVITVDGEAGVTIQNVKIDGTSTQANDGVYVIDGASVTIQNDFIRNVAPSGGAEGIGVRVGRFQGATTPGGTVTVSNNTITGYSWAGVVVTNGSAGTVSSNTVTGDNSKSIVQNGIEFSFGATGTIYGNTVSGNGFVTGNRSTGSVGIFLYKAGAGVQVGLTNNGNTVTGNDLGISVVDGNNPTVQYNTVTNSLDYGIGFDSSDGVNKTVGATVQFNSSSNPNATGTHIPDGFYLTYLTGTTTTPVTITNNSGNSNGGVGFNLTLGLDAGTINFNTNNANGNVGHGYWLHDLSVNLSTNPYGPVSIVKNNANGNGGDGVRVENVQFTGSSPSAPMTTGMNNSNGNSGNGIGIVNCVGVVVDGGSTGSNANGNAMNGVLISGSSSVAVQNYQSQSNTKDGILVQNSQSVSILSDTVGGSSNTGNKQNGIEFVNSNNGTVKGNTVRFNSFNGILLDSNSTGNTIGGTASGEANTLTNNDQAGKNFYFDANDQSGTSTTVLNNWVQNTIGTKNKSVIH